MSDKDVHLDAKWEPNKLYPEVEVMYRKNEQGEWVATALYRYSPDNINFGYHWGNKPVGS